MAFFLNQVWAYLGRYALAYPDEMSVVNAITANLKGEAAEWVTGLHDKRCQNWEMLTFSWESLEPGSRMRTSSRKLNQRYKPSGKGTNWWQNTCMSSGGSQAS